MEGNISPKIVGSAVIGFALIFGAYVITNFGQSNRVVQTASVQEGAVKPAPRVSIAVDDKNNNGIEDWRDEFITTEPIYLNNDEEYIPPDTLTGNFAIGFFEGYIRNRSNGVFSQPQEEFIDGRIEGLVQATEQKLFNSSDITVMTDWSNEDIVNYANTVAATIARYDIGDMDQELIILSDIAKNPEREDRRKDLNKITSVYYNYRTDTLKIPVPEPFAKEHLDLINSFEAIRTDIEAMELIREDPIKTLLRLKRYEDDALGLSIALENMFTVLAPHADLFTPEDPALLFVLFSPYYQG